MKRNALVLIEILTVVVVIGILATIVIAQHSGFKGFTERAYAKEAQANLRLMAAAEKIYHRETGQFYPYPGYGGPAVTVDNINQTLRIALPPTTGKWDYTFNTTVTGFTIIAQRKGVGGYLDCSYTITDSTEPVASAQCP